MKTIGTLIEVHDIKRTRNSQVRNFVLSCETPTRTGVIQNEFQFTLTSDRVGDIDRYEIGDRIEVDFNLGASKYYDRDTGVTIRYNLFLCKHITRTQGRPVKYNPTGLSYGESKTGLI